MRIVDMKTKFPPVDFERLGFKCGLEIHQQLNTKKKLFCHCPVGLRKEPPNATILRHMRPTLSELGEYDGTALMEFRTKKNVIYQLNKGSTCTYEMDDTPPFELNQEALDIALEIATATLSMRFTYPENNTSTAAYQQDFSVLS